MSRPWSIPRVPWVLHAAPFMDTDDKGFVDVQASGQKVFESRLLSTRIRGAAPRPPHWIVAADSRADYLAYRGGLATRGRSMRWIAHRVRERPPAAVHAHYGPTAVQVARLADYVDAPLYASFYGYDVSMQAIVGDPRWRARYERLFAQVAGVFAEGPAMGDKVARLGCPAEKIEVIRLPVDEEVLAACDRTQPEGFVVTAAGRLVEKKGFDTAIRAFARALRGKPDASLSIVGGGELERELRQLAADEGVGDQVRWHGTLPFAEFTRTAAAGSVALFPSRTARSGDAEGGAPVTLIEMQWLGVPAIVSDHDDLPFAAAPELPVLPSADVDAWAEALRAFYDAPGDLAKLGAAGQAWVRERNSVARNAADREAVYGGRT